MDMIDYEVSWWGAKWRTFEQPQIAVADPDPVTVIVRTQTTNSRGLVLAQVADDWETALQVGKRAGLSPGCVREWLMQLWREGVIERQEVPRTHGHRARSSWYQYRRSQGNTSW